MRNSQTKSIKEAIDELEKKDNFTENKIEMFKKELEFSDLKKNWLLEFLKLSTVYFLYFKLLNIINFFLFKIDFNYQENMFEPKIVDNRINEENALTNENKELKNETSVKPAEKNSNINKNGLNIVKVNPSMTCIIQ